MGHPYLISLDLSQGLKSVQGCRLSCRLLQIDEKIAVDDDLRFKVIITLTIIVIALPLLLTYWQYPNFMHDQDIGLLWLKKDAFVFSCPEQLNRTHCLLVCPLPLTIKAFKTLQSDPRDL